MERSSINLIFKAAGLLIFDKHGHFGLGISGRSAAPLNYMINKMTPSTVPWGEEPGSERNAERIPRNFIIIFLSVKYEIKMSRSQPGTFILKRSSITCWWDILLKAFDTSPFSNSTAVIDALAKKEEKDRGNQANASAKIVKILSYKAPPRPIWTLTVKELEAYFSDLKSLMAAEDGVYIKKKWPESKIS